MILKAPDTQIDASIKERLKMLNELEHGKDLLVKECLDDSAYQSLASDFAMSLMDMLYKVIIEIDREEAFETYLVKQYEGNTDAESIEVYRPLDKAPFDSAWDTQFKEKMKLYYEYAQLVREHEDLNRKHNND